MMRIFKSKRIREQEEILLTQYTWDFLTKDDFEKVPLKRNEKYESSIVAEVAKSFAKGIFRKNCTKIGFDYEEVKDVFFKQNKQFFELTKTLWLDESKFYGEFGIDMCENLLIIPKCSRVDCVIAEIRNWSLEEQAEAMQLLSGKKIKITVEDI